MSRKPKHTATPSYTAAQQVARLNQPAGVRRDGLADKPRHRKAGWWARLLGGKR